MSKPNKNKSIVYIKNNDLVVTSEELSIGFRVEHRAIKRLIVKYKNELETLGLIATPLQKVDRKNKGRRLEIYELNESQATYISTLLPNTKKVREFKLFLVKQFFRQRKILQNLIIQKQNAEWQKLREEGKLDRREETDVIKEFIEYAYEQGSKKAKEYYRSISKMVNTTLFHVELLEHKYPNLRDLLNRYQLVTLQNADRIIARALEEGMQKRMYYKEIYKLAKSRIESFVDLVGKSKLLEIENSDPKLLR